LLARACLLVLACSCLLARARLLARACLLVLACSCLLARACLLVLACSCERRQYEHLPEAVAPCNAVWTPPIWTLAWSCGSVQCCVSTANMNTCLKLWLRAMLCDHLWTHGLRSLCSHHISHIFFFKWQDTDHGLRSLYSLYISQIFLFKRFYIPSTFHKYLFSQWKEIDHGLRSLYFLSFPPSFPFKIKGSWLSRLYSLSIFWILSTLQCWKCLQHFNFEILKCFMQSHRNSVFQIIL